MGFTGMEVTNLSLEKTSVAESGIFAKLTSAVSIWFARVDARIALAELSDRMILDIGMDPEEVKREIAKPFWRA